MQTMAAAKTSQSQALSLLTERRCGLSAATLHVFAGLCGSIERIGAITPRLCQSISVA